MLYAVNERLCVVCARVADTPTPKLPGPAEMHTLPLAEPLKNIVLENVALKHAHWFNSFL
jgi:hypothetical protein